MLVVTGASGLLGATLLLAAQEAGRESVGLCHHYLLRGSRVRTFSMDLTDDAATRKLLFDLRPDGIVHCAAATNVDWCEDNPRQTEALNVQASASLAEIACQLDAQFVYISTDSVFDGQRGGYCETDIPAPVNTYAKSKLAGEREVFRRHPAPTVVRVNIYGFNVQKKESLAEWILRMLEEGKYVPGFTDVFFTPILVNDLAAVVLAILENELVGLYHVTGSERISKFEFARRLATVCGFDAARISPHQIRDAVLRAPRPLDTSLNTEKIRLVTGRSMPDVDLGLRRFQELRSQNYARMLKSYLGGA